MNSNESKQPKAEDKSTEIKQKAPKKEITAIRVDKVVAKLMRDLITKANKKDFGRRIRAPEILALALSKVSDSEIKGMQQKTLSHMDRMRLVHKEYQRKIENISEDAFIGLVAEKGLKNLEEMVAVPATQTAAKTESKNAAFSERKNA